MTFIYLIVWFSKDRPVLDFDPINNWAMALIFCVVFDVLGKIGSNRS